jgi:dUTP pyrophosphatase
VFVTNAPGTIDSGYRGEAKILLSSVSGNAFLSNFDKTLKIGNVEIQIGDRVAQIAVREVPPSVMLEVEDLDETERGVNGFGSSGLSALPEAKPEKPSRKG